MKLENIPNVISLLRIFLVAPVILLLLNRQFGLALVVFIIAGISDGFDGFLAKKYGWISRLGAILDPLADKLLLVSCYLVLGGMAILPDWLVLTVILRDLMIVTAAIIYHYTIAPFNAEPSIISKINTFFQIVLVVVVVFKLGIHPVPAFVITVLTFLVLFTTILSWLDYGWIFYRRYLALGRTKS